MMGIPAAPELDRRSALRGIVSVAGAAIVLPTMASLAGCSSAPASIANKALLLDAIVDRIIPETDTPGAKAAGVADYVSAVFNEHFDEEQQHAFSDGLQSIEEQAKDQGLHTFADATPQQKDRFLAALDEAGDPTWQQLRDMTIFGYYTSEVATQELAYEELPGRYDGCVPLADIGSAWLARGV